MISEAFSIRGLELKKSIRPWWLIQKKKKTKYAQYYDVNLHIFVCAIYISLLAPSIINFVSNLTEKYAAIAERVYRKYLMLNVISIFILFILSFSNYVHAVIFILYVMHQILFYVY